MIVREWARKPRGARLELHGYSSRETWRGRLTGHWAGLVFWIYTPLGLLQLGYAAALNRSAWLTDDEIRKLGPI